MFPPAKTNMWLLLPFKYRSDANTLEALIGLKVNAYIVINTFENPNNVSIKEFIAAAKENILTHTFPAFSITAIKISGKLK